jgi:ubiquinone/menaquinone biosynthesis C-methylase UbiE
MTLPAYEYRGLIAQSWDLMRGDTSEWADRFFYLEIIKRYGHPVLDVGCGTGRLLLDYLAQGIDIDGVDNSPEMLALCLEKAAQQGLAVQVFAQYMETLALPRRYRTILIPSSSLQLITDSDMADQAMRRLIAHLEPGGAIVASCMALWKTGEPLERAWEVSTVRPEDGATIRRSIRSLYDPATECESTEDRYQVIHNDTVIAEEVHARTPATRSYTQAQARALFKRAGLVDIRLHSKFSLDPAQPEDDMFTILGCKSH